MRFRALSASAVGVATFLAAPLLANALLGLIYR
jgi:hypothetical protein